MTMVTEISIKQIITDPRMKDPLKNNIVQVGYDLLGYNVFRI